MQHEVISFFSHFSVLVVVYGRTISGFEPDMSGLFHAEIFSQTCSMHSRIESVADLASFQFITLRKACNKAKPRVIEEYNRFG